MTNDLITVFGGSGFVGRAIVQALCKEGYRVRAAVRRPHQVLRLRVLGDPGQVELVQANLLKPESVAAACTGAFAVINCVGLLYEKGKQNFAALHVAGAQAAAEAARNAGAARFIQISAIGADERAGAAYARTKAYGEEEVRRAFPGAVVLRPSIIFGEDDSFFNRFAGMAAGLPILPLIDHLPCHERADSEHARQEILHIRHHSLYAPRDFDISPYFQIIKPAIESGFDYRSLTWDREASPSLRSIR